MDHTRASRDRRDLMRAIELRGAAPLVRLTSNDPNLAKRVMDAGARGVIVPQVNSAEEAARAVAAVTYPPIGHRGVGLARAHGYGPGFRAYADRINDDVVVIAQIEHIEAIEHLDEILAVPGIDGTMIGPYDLSASLGKPGRFEDPDVVAALDRYETICRAAGKPMGYHVIESTAAAAHARIARGYAFVAFSTDALFLGNTCRGELARLRDAIGADAPPRS